MPYVEPYGPIGYGTPPGLVRFKDHMLARFPTARFGGMYNPASKTSSGSPSRHQVTQAVDLMCDAATGAGIMRYVVAIADSINLQQCISHHEIITVSRWSEGVRRYGPDDHAGGNGHAHIEMGWQAALNWTPRGADPAPPAPVAPPALTSEEDDAMPSLHYTPQNQTHTFWRGTGARDGHLLHAWRNPGGGPLGFEDFMVAGGKRQAVTEYVPAGAPVSVMLDPVGLDMVVSVPVGDGALLRMSWSGTAGPWAASIVGR